MSKRFLSCGRLGTPWKWNLAALMLPLQNAICNLSTLVSLQFWHLGIYNPLLLLLLDCLFFFFFSIRPLLSDLEPPGWVLLLFDCQSSQFWDLDGGQPHFLWITPSNHFFYPNNNFLFYSYFVSFAVIYAPKLCLCWLKQFWPSWCTHHIKIVVVAVEMFVTLVSKSPKKETKVFVEL